MLFSFAMDAAARTSLEEHRKAFGRILSVGVTDDAFIDESEFFLRVLADLEAPELRLLTKLCETDQMIVLEDVSDPADKEGTWPCIWRFSGSVVLARLLSLNLVSVQEGDINDAFGGKRTRQFVVSDFGDRIMGWLRED